MCELFKNKHAKLYYIREICKLYGRTKLHTRICPSVEICTKITRALKRNVKNANWCGNAEFWI